MRRLLAVVLVMTIGTASVANAQMQLGVAALSGPGPWTRALGVSVVRLYASDITAPWYEWRSFNAQIAGYERRGIDVELVLRYTPKDGGTPKDIPAFAAAVRRVVTRLGRNHRLTAVQVTNEANLATTPDADGYYRYAKRALVAGLRDASVYPWVKIGFNYTPVGGRRLWPFLARHRVRPDWVGLDVYPAMDPASTVAQTVALTRELARRAHIRAPVYVSEGGFPTANPADEASALRSMVIAAARASAQQFCWFMLRDQLGGPPYGLEDASGAKRPAFWTYRRLIDTLKGGIPWSR